MTFQPPPDLQPWDWHRIFIGEQPLWFVLEILFRTAFMYLWAILLVRIVSRRAVGQLSLIEFLLVVSLGSAVGDPMFYADVPLVHGMVVVAGVILLYRGLIFLLNRTEPVEVWVEGSPVEVVRDGLISVEGLKDANLNREKLFELLRREGIRHLGEVEFAYQEQGGEVNVFRRPEGEITPGLRTVPPWDLEPPPEFDCDEILEAEMWLGCRRCGKVVFCPRDTAPEACADCGEHVWADAVDGLPSGS